MTDEPVQETKGFLGRTLGFAERVFDKVVDAGGEDFRIIQREVRLFLGSALFLLGLLSFEHGKYCDGNSADYLSCTRPATYYYFDYLDIALVVLGISLILLWVLRPVKSAKKVVH